MRHPRGRPEAVGTVTINGHRPTATTSSPQPRAPGPPINVRSALSGPKTLLISWGQPTDPGDTAIRYYEVVASPGGTTKRTDGTTTEVSFTLPVGVYTFTVTATNESFRASPPSDPSNPIRAVDVPGPPTGLHLRDNDGDRIASDWVAPLSDGGAPVATYRVVWSADNQTSHIVEGIPAGPQLFELWLCTTPLPSGLTETYTFRVAAVNEANFAGPYSAPVTISMGFPPPDTC